MPKVLLHYSPGACSLASHVLLNETGLDFALTKHEARRGLPESFRTINPKMRVPVLSIDDATITETPAIFTAIAQLAPEKQLLGKTQLEIVRTYEWLNWLSGTVHGQAFGGFLRPHRYIDDTNHYDEIRAKGWKNVLECFDTIESDLTGVHAVGDSFTAVDAFLYVFFRWANEVSGDMAEKYPKYTDLVVELAKRRSVQAALQVEGISSLIPKL